MASPLSSMVRVLRHGGCLATRACRGDLHCLQKGHGVVSLEPVSRSFASKAEKNCPVEQAKEIAELKKQHKKLNDETINFHTKQKERHQVSLKKLQELKKTDKDPYKRDVFIKSHTESIEAHDEVLRCLRAMEKKFS